MGIECNFDGCCMKLLGFTLTNKSYKQYTFKSLENSIVYSKLFEINYGFEHCMGIECNYDGCCMKLLGFLCMF